MRSIHSIALDGAGVYKTSGELERKGIVMEAHSASKTALIMSIISVIFLAANLRAPITSVGPLVPFIREDLGLSNTAAGILTTVPLLAFAVLSPFASRLARAFGMEIVLFVSLLFLLAGHIFRPLGGVSLVFIGTILIGAAIAVDNVLMPALVKEKFSNYVGWMTGVYTVAMNLTGALASGLSVPLASATGFGWRGSLGCWAVLTVVALALWALQLRSRKKDLSQPTGSERRSLWKSRLAWQVTLFMGLQSLLFYTLITWLPTMLQNKGMNPETSGWALFLFQFAQLPFMFIVPVIAEKMKTQTLLVWVTFVLKAAGIGGFLFGSPALVWLWAVMLGIGAGFAFSLAMMLFALRSRSAMQAADLSAMAQSFGYLLAAFGPPLFGSLYDITKGWTLPLFLVLLVSAFLLLAGIGAAKDRYVTES